jgi:predicted RNase H-like HicB family nuclease
MAIALTLNAQPTTLNHFAASGVCRNSFKQSRKERLVFHRKSGDSPAMEIVFTVTQENDGGYVAECLSHDIFTQGNTWEELRANVREAVSAYFFDQPKPAAVRLHLVRDELLASA